MGLYHESKVMWSILLVLLQYVVSEEVMQLRMPGNVNRKFSNLSIIILQNSKFKFRILFLLYFDVLNDDK